MRHLIDGKSGDAKDPMLTPKTIFYLCSAHQHRTEAVKKLSEFEIFGIAHLFSLINLQLYRCNKSNITTRLATASAQVVSPNSDIVIELFPVIKSKQSVNCPTFDHFAESV